MQQLIEFSRRIHRPSAKTVLYSLRADDDGLRQAVAQSALSGKEEVYTIQTRPIRVLSIKGTIIRIRTFGLFGTELFSVTRTIMAGNRNI